MGSVNSHIQMPKCVLRNFMDDQQLLHYYDFQTGTIKQGRAASLDTELGYYSQDVEDYLRDNVEAPFGRVMAKVKNITKDDVFEISNTLFDDVRTFLYALMSRSVEMLDAINKSSAFFQFLPEQAQHDYAAVQGIELSKQRGLLDDWLITFAVNDSEVPFVLPQLGLYPFGLKFCQSCHNLPISPRTSITLFPNKYIAEFVNNGVVKLLFVADDEIAQKFNNKAFATEKKHNRQRIISDSRKEIERLTELYQYQL